ncbi:MAG: hypothetical protein WC792_05500 [Candidatus Micrarchaeia archaeon]|jgi:hypothetical protein
MRGTLALDFGLAIATLALCTMLALTQVRNAGSETAQLLETARLESRAIGVADWIAKHCGTEMGIAKCGEISGTKTRAALVASVEGFEKMRAEEGTLREFFGISDGEKLAITLEKINGGNFGAIGRPQGGACVSRLLLLSGENFSFAALGTNAGLDEAVLRVCAANGGNGK